MRIRAPWPPIWFFHQNFDKRTVAIFVSLSTYYCNWMFVRTIFIGSCFLNYSSFFLGHSLKILLTRIWLNHQIKITYLSSERNPSRQVRIFKFRSFYKGLLHPDRAIPENLQPLLKSRSVHPASGCLWAQIRSEFLQCWMQCCAMWLRERRFESGMPRKFFWLLFSTNKMSRSALMQIRSFTFIPAALHYNFGRWALSLLTKTDVHGVETMRMKGHIGQSSWVQICEYWMTGKKCGHTVRSLFFKNF